MSCALVIIYIIYLIIYIILFEAFKCFTCVFVSVLYVSLVFMKGSEGGVGFPRTEIMNGCEPPCGHRVLNLDSLQEHQSPLASEPPLYSPFIFSDRV